MGTPWPSIWMLEMIQTFASLEAFTACSFDQCIYRACGVKPTTLLLPSLPHFRERERAPDGAEDDVRADPLRICPSFRKKQWFFVNGEGEEASFSLS